LRPQPDLPGPSVTPVLSKVRFAKTVNGVQSFLILTHIALYFSAFRINPLVL
ncbi:hypothetical protein PanWU01x14_109690, partial [Parasponia andersonii]